jgi:hypothetical protein
VQTLTIFDGTSYFYGYTSKQISFNILSQNTAFFTLDQSNIHNFLLPLETTKGPIGLGTSNLYYTGVNDGFMLRDQGANTCLQYVYASSALQLYGTE